MSQVLYRKWRPHRWEQVVGQDHVVQTLRNAVTAERVAHAHLFAGPRGTGKTTTARLLAKSVNCLDPDLSVRPCDQCAHCQSVNQGRFLDLIEIDAASNTSVEDVRDLREKINFSPNQGRYKVYIIDEVHMLSTAAFNALLKTLEEPPSHAIFILATTEVHKIPATVISRCQRHEFRRLPVGDIVSCIHEMAANENIQIDDDALRLIARQSTGSLRDAISFLDQLATSGQTITLDMTQQVLGTAGSQSVLEIIDALLTQDSAGGLNHIHRALDAGSDPRQFARQIVDYLRSLLLERMGNSDQVDATAEMRAQIASHAQRFTLPELLEVIKAFNQAASYTRSAWHPSLPLELAFVESIDKSQPVANDVPPKQQPVSSESRPSPGASLRTSDPVDVVEDARQPDEQSVSSTPEGALTIEMVNDHWHQIITLVRPHSKNTEALLKSGRLLGVKGNTLYFGLSEVLKSKMEKRENMEFVHQAIQQVLGPGVSIRCVVSTGRDKALPPDIDSDGMVAAALRDLGGEIVDIQ